MMGIGTTKTRKAWASFAVLALLVLAFGMKSVLPAGFMPSVGKGGAVTITVCSGMGAKTITLPADASFDHGKAGGKSGGQEDARKICDYQVLASAKLFPPHPVSYLAALVTQDAPRFSGAQESVYTRHLLPSEARGPPLV